MTTSRIIALLFAALILSLSTPSAAWQESNDGLLSWSIVGVAVDHQDPSTVYALTRSQGLYKSENGGDSWVEKNDGLPDPHVVSMGHTHGNLLTMDPADPSILYSAFNGEAHKYKGAEGWINVNNGIDVCNPPSVAGIVVDPRDSNHIFAAHIASGCSGGIFESFDADADADLTWTQIASWSGSGEIENDAWTLAIHPDSSSMLFAAPLYLGFLYSTDGGHYWRRATPLGEGRKAGNVVVVHPAVTNRVILGHPAGIHVGTYVVDGDELVWSWTDLTDEVYGHIWDIDISVSDSNIVYAVSSAGLFRSNDGGLSWAQMGSHGDLFLKSLAIDPTNPEIVYLGSGNGMLCSSDGGSTLTDVTNGIPPEMEVQATGIAPSDPAVYYCNLYGVAFCGSQDRGKSWHPRSSDSGVTGTITILVDDNDPEVVYAGLEKVHKSDDGGATWVVSLDPERNEQFFDLEMDSQGNLYATSVYTITAEERYAELYRSTDGGATWEGPNENFHHSSICVGPIAIDSEDAIYVASYDYLRRSTDGGETWTRLTNGLTGNPYDRWIDGLAVDRVEPNRLYMAARSHREFASTDHGDNWSLLEVTGPDYPGKIIIDHEDHSTFYVFGMLGWYRYADFGVSSEEMSTEGIDSPYMNFRRSALQDPLDSGRFVTGDFFQGFLVFDTTDSLAAVPELQIHTPRPWMSVDNAPNPFNRSTVIRFDVPWPARVRVGIYDISGRLVKDVVSEHLEGGCYSAVWDGTGSQGHPVAPGVYFCRVTARNCTATQKILLSE